MKFSRFAKFKLENKGKVKKMKNEKIVIIIIIIIIRGQFIKHRKWWFGSPNQGRFDIFNDDGQRVQ